MGEKMKLHKLTSEFVIISVKILLDASKRDPLQTCSSKKGEYILRERKMCSGIQVSWGPGTWKESRVEAVLLLVSPSLGGIVSGFVFLVSVHSPCSSAYVAALWLWSL